MALVIPPGYIQIAHELRNSGDPEPWYVTYAIDAGDWANSDTAAIAWCRDRWNEHIQAGFRTTTAHTATIGRVGQDGGPALTIRLDLNQQGSSAAEKLPQNCALLIQKQTARAGRPGKGRMFLPNYIGESTVSDVGVISNSERTALQTQFTNWLADLIAPPDSEPLPMVLLHNGGAPGGTTPSVVNFLNVSGLIATQRRRLRR